MTNFFETAPTVQEVMKSRMDDVQRRAENGTVAQENVASGTRRQAALDALYKFEQSFIIAVGDKSPFAKTALELPKTIRSALQSPRVPEMVCDGCGRVGNEPPPPPALSCCPERRLVPVQDLIRELFGRPQVPVIPGLDDAIAHFIKFWGEDKVRQDENILFKAARAYAELQKGV